MDSAEAELWKHAADVAAALREGRPASPGDKAWHESLFPPPVLPRDGLGEAGRKLWRDIIDAVAEGWELDEKERHYLVRACRVADEIATLEAVVDRDGAIVAGSRGQPIVHPAVTEARQLRLVELRLLRQVNLGGEDAEETPARRRAQQAANTRWTRKAQVDALKRAVRLHAPDAI